MNISLLYEEDPGFISAALVRTSEDYESFSKGVYGLLRQAKEIAEEAGDIRFDSENREDGITLSLKGYLAPYRANIAMSHINGNADLVVQNDLRTLKWIGEAKILDDNYSNNHLYEGILQLATRYSVGGMNEQHGGLLIYNFKPRTVRCMERWKDYFLRRAPEDDFEDIGVIEIEEYDCGEGFFTEHSHHKSGLPFVICHFPLTFTNDPLDKSAKARKGRK